MAAAVRPRWNPQSYYDDGGPPLPTGNFGSSVLIVEEIDGNGNTIVVIDDLYKTITATIPPASPLPPAGTTSDPHSLLQKGPAPPSLPPTPTPTPSTSSEPGPYSDSAPSASPSPSPSSSTQPPSSPSASNSQSGANAPPPKEHKSHPPVGALVVLPIIVIAGLLIFFLVWRKRRAARRGAMVQHEKMRSPEDGLSQGPPAYSESTNGLLMTPAAAATPLSTTVSNNPLRPSGSRHNRLSQQPVILNTNMRDGAYLTGIDTSDGISLASGTGDAIVNPFDARSMTSTDEPPPPYRPRSVPSISRETSVRHPSQDLTVHTNLAAVSERNLLRRGDDDDDLTPVAAPRRNPFDDPEDDDDDRGGLTPVQSPRWSRGRSRGDDDARSMISEFSFEHEHR